MGIDPSRQRGMMVESLECLIDLFDGKTPERFGVFVRATIGGDGVPTLAGVSGLKEGEQVVLQQ